jgi:hypothetical protein
MPTTFKDISAFFENKTLEQKKIIRAKRSLSLNRYIPDSPKLDIISSTEEKSITFHHQIKRIKKTHKSQFDSEFIENNNTKTNEDKHRSSKKLLLIMTMIFVYFFLTNIYKNLFRLNQQLDVFPQQSEPPISLISNNNLISQYGQFIRNRFFSSLDLLVTFIGQIFFRIEKYEYKNNISYVATSTYEHIYEWFLHSFKERHS